MDHELVRRLIGEKLREATMYGVVAIVGTLINAYGNLLVPWLRGAENPFYALITEFQVRPGVTTSSIVLGYVFPLCVSVFSSVATRYKHRRFESVADFPDRKPDPVFRASRSGEIVEVGASTKVFFETYKVDSAQKILGEKMWADIASKAGPGGGATVYFEAEGVSYIVSHAPTADDEVNIYLTRLPA